MTIRVEGRQQVLCKIMAAPEARDFCSQYPVGREGIRLNDRTMHCLRYTIVLKAVLSEIIRKSGDVQAVLVENQMNKVVDTQKFFLTTCFTEAFTVISPSAAKVDLQSTTGK